MTVDTNEDSRHCYELEKRSDTFLKEAESSNLKVFLLWIMNNYKRIETVSSLKNYWRVLRMHILDKTGRVFSESDKRDIRNVRNVLKSEETLTDRSISRSISNISRFSFVFVHFSWKNSSQIAMICIFDSILTESLMIRYFRMSVSEFSISQKYLWANSSIVDCALSSISESSLIFSTSTISVWAILQWLKIIIWTAIVKRTLWWLSILTAKLIASSSDIMIMTMKTITILISLMTAIATTTLIWLMTTTMTATVTWVCATMLTRIATQMMNVLQNSKKLDRFCIDILLSI